MAQTRRTARALLQYLIDGYNLLFSGGGRRPRDPQALEAAREELIRLLNRFHAVRRGRSLLAFDCRKPFFLFGLSRRQRRGDVEVRFAPEGSSADDLLQGLIREAKDPQAMTVVTSDRAILDVAVARGMPTVSAKAFWETLVAARAEDAGGPEGRAGRGFPRGTPAGRRPPGPRPAGPGRREPDAKREGIPPGEVDYWMKEFGMTDEGPEGKRD
jgi:predicted RNA-binding protein with PIN domain